MKILLVHNYTGDYAVGGESQVFEQEAELLRKQGHEVREFRCTNNDLLKRGICRKIKAFYDAPWSKYGYGLVKEQIDGFKPDLVHFHNFFFVLSPSVFHAAKDCGVPSVVTLHNYRWVSPCSQLMRNGEVCERCVGKNPWRMMWYRCYKNSFFASLLRYRIYYLGKMKRQWHKMPDAVIALTEFARQKMIASDVPQEKIFVKPNYVDDPLLQREQRPQGDYAIFLGRLSKEKGVDVLIDAWKAVDYPLVVVGGGPMEEQLKKNAPGNVTFVGEKSHEESMDFLLNSAFMVFPSVWYEGFGLTLIESLACQRPVIASDLGFRSEIIRHDKTGYLYDAYSHDDLAAKARQMISDREACQKMGENGRQLYLEKYTPEKNYPTLMSIYEKAIENFQKNQ